MNHTMIIGKHELTNYIFDVARDFNIIYDFINNIFNFLVMKMEYYYIVLIIFKHSKLFYINLSITSKIKGFLF